ncbi:hypothetical protein [Paraflavitalea sp. CAU 1676]|uniref:glycine-rich domain-containing protein n=1 Tax=Paraflavitalea sp. CAU 1676 TaxID=3032598 RepID=UPI0023DBA5B4|nr:hypothetical protein [Paraflavitalea sp. CAU 1676]MDF2188151.1 hypothetical protein [Paraflavitalea sp. CAU 1676]
MLMNETQLWSKLEAYSPDNPTDAFSFSQRLARENGWPIFFTERVIAEYKKFLFLCMISPHPVTPSDEVDQAWHLHLVYTKSYWNDLCKDILGKDIHHTPTEGGSAERDKFTNYYEATLQLYRDKFGHEPPDDIWPPTHKRFGDDDYVRANKITHWIILKQPWHRHIAGIALVVLGILVSLASWNFAFLIILGGAGIILLLQYVLRNMSFDTYGEGTWDAYRRDRNHKAGGCGGGCAGCGGNTGCNGGGGSGCSGDGGCSSGCGGGCGGGGD